MDIRASLANIPDPRIERCKKHLLMDILLLCIIAMVCGVQTVEDIVFFGITHIKWLKQYLALPNGIPSADTILRVLGRIDHVMFEVCFLDWTRGYFYQELGEAEFIDITKDHGRIEKREAWVYKDISWFEDREDWSGLKAFGCIRSTRTVKGETIVD